MQLFVIFISYVLIVIAVLAGKHHKKIEPLSDKENRTFAYLEGLIKCIKNANITHGEYAFALAGNATGDVHEKAKCVHACILKEHGVINSNGTIDEIRALEHMVSSEFGTDVEVQRGNILGCSKIREENECNTAQKLLECLNITSSMI